MAVVAVGV